MFKALENEKIKNQILVASEIQRLIVPEKLPRIPKLSLSGRYLPCQGIGGDFYSVKPLNKDETIVAIADVSGKSIPGALLVSTLHAMLNAYLDFTDDLSLIMRNLNQKIIELSTADRFITIFLAKINTHIGNIEYISAGHNPQFLHRRPFRINTLSSTGMPIGIINYNYQVQQCSFQAGDVLLLYTDGVIEARNRGQVEFGEDNLMALMHAPEAENVDALCDSVVQAVQSHCQPEAPHDDITLLAIRYKGENNRE